MAKVYVPMFGDFYKLVEFLGDDEVGRLALAMSHYVTGGEEAALEQMTGNERFVWPAIRSQFERHEERKAQTVQANRANGAKGGRPSKPNETENNPEKPNETEKTQQNPKKPNKTQKNHKKEIEIKIKKEIERNIDDEEDDARDVPDGIIEETAPADPYDTALSDDWVKVVKAYEANVGMMPNPGSASGSDLISYYGEMGADVLIAAIEATSRAAPSNPARYLTAILKKWSEAGVKDKDAAQAMIQDHARQTQQAQPQARAAPAKHNPALDYMQHDNDWGDFRPTSADELRAAVREMDERRKARAEEGTT